MSDGRRHALCWDCAKACGGCSWSNHWEHRPVPGWVAEETRVRMNNDTYEPTFLVIACPEFERDGIGGGVSRPHDQQKRVQWMEAALRRNSK